MFIVMEIQTNADGSIGTFVWSFESKNEAESKYHSILAVAAVSAVPMHAASLLSNQGYSISSQCYIHKAE